PRYGVFIDSKMGDSNIIVQCKSRDDDVGTRTLRPNQVYKFFFRGFWFGTTLFFCNLWYSKYHVAFVAFEDVAAFRDHCGYNNCRWMVRKDGIFLYNEKQKIWNFEPIYHWNY